MTKKVVLVLVEGEAEETVLTEYLEELFEEQEVFIDVQNGDVLADWNQDKNVKNAIGDVIKAYLKKTKFRASDLTSFRKKSPILKECEGVNSTNE